MACPPCERGSTVIVYIGLICIALIIMVFATTRAFGYTLLWFLILTCCFGGAIVFLVWLLVSLLVWVFVSLLCMSLCMSICMITYAEINHCLMREDSSITTLNCFLITGMSSCLMMLFHLFYILRTVYSFWTCMRRDSYWYRLES